MKNIAVFASGTGSNFEQIVTRGISGARISLLVTDKICNALTIAHRHAIPAVTFERKDFETKTAMEEAIIRVLEERRIDLIVLAGYMRLLSPPFVHRYENRIINIHPSLLPLYKGKHAIQQALEDGRKLYGVTVHYVNEGMDDGQIIEQVRVVYDGLDIEQLESRVHEAEYELYTRVIQHLVDQEATT